jgi:hypothetical protein
MGFQELSKLSDIGEQFSELIHQIPNVPQTINAQPTRKHDGRSPSSRISPIVVLQMP